MSDNTTTKVPFIPSMSIPEVKFNKNGYEIRTEILYIAKTFLENEYRAKFNGWEISIEQDKKSGKVISTVNMPAFPGINHILDAAEKMYSFVNKK